jgi:hypothetical protein
MEVFANGLRREWVVTRAIVACFKVFLGKRGEVFALLESTHMQSSREGELKFD